MAKFIRWTANVVGLEEFSEQTRAAISELAPGTFLVIAVSVDRQLYVKRLTRKAFQLGLETGRELQTTSSIEIVCDIRASFANQAIADEPVCR